MKLLMTFLFIGLTTFCVGQTDTTLKYSEVIQVDGINKEVLYLRAKSWANDVFSNSKNVIQIDDKEAGEIEGKANLNASFSWNALGKRSYETIVSFKFHIILKDNKYKYIFTDFIEKNTYGFLLTSAIENPYEVKGIGKKNMNMIWTSLKVSTEDKMLAILSKLKEIMKRKSETDF